MKETYDIVPNILTSKDVDYLSDLFNISYGGYKSCMNSSKNVNDAEINAFLEKVANNFQNSLSSALKILKEEGAYE